MQAHAPHHRLQRCSLERLAGDCYADLAALRSTAPVSYVPARGGWLVSSHALAVQVLCDWRLFTVQDPRFSTEQVVGASMLSRDGAEHSRHRAPFAEPFRPKRVRARFGTRVAELVGELIEGFRDRGSADLRTELAMPLSVGVMAEVLGLPGTDTTTMLSWYAAISAGVTALSRGGDCDGAASVAFSELSAHLGSVIERGEDSLLVDAARSRAGLSTAEIVSNAAVSLFGGIETTEAMISIALGHLLEHPDQLDLVRTDAYLIDNAVEESLRLEPAAAFVDRYATADTVLGGARVARGDLVAVSLTGANRDPAVFAEPDRFDARRAQARKHLAFAHGPHFCVGLDLARLQTATVLAAVLDGLPGLRPAGRSLDPPRGLIFRKPATLRVRWDRATE
ncbi:MAG: cytochrome P450 [Sciscionella sp.]